jgi:lambda family phage portal protein
MAFPFARFFRRTTPAPAPGGRRMLEGASGRRFDKTPAFGATGQEVLAGGPLVRGRARHLRFNDPHGANAAAILRTGLVGYGATPASPDSEAVTAFLSWAGDTGFAGLQGEVADALVTDGEALLIFRTDDQGRLRLQHVPAEQLDESHTVDLAGGGYIAGGIEFDSDDQVTAYHFRPARPTDQFQTHAPPVRVAAQDVIHVFRRLGAGQTRGLSWFAPVVLAMNEHAQLADANLVTAKIQAMLTAFLVDQNGSAQGGPFADGQQVGDLSEVSLEPGTVRVLPPGWDIRFSTPMQMAESVNLMGVSLRAIAAGLQIPEFLLSGDMRGVNYSSARTALVQFRQHLETIQHTLLVPSFFAPIWRRWHLLETLRGTFPMGDAPPVEWHFPSQPWVDPLKDAEATALLIDRGLLSRRMAVASLGYSVEALDAEIAADKAREKALGLAFPAQPVAPRAPQKEGADDAE